MDVRFSNCRALVTRVIRAALPVLVGLAFVLVGRADDRGFGFSDPVAYPVSGDPYALAVADFDGADGMDVAVSTESATLKLLMNNGDGTLRAGQTVPVPSWALSIVAADFDGIGGPDVATADFRAGSVSVLRNDGRGQLAAPETYPLGRPAALVDDIVAADFDGRNGPDLAVNQSSFDVAEINGVSILFNNGDGTFAPEVFYEVNVAGAHAIATGDLDGMKGPDLVVANRDARSLFVYLNTGDGTLVKTGAYDSPGAPIDVAVADLDGVDGPDLVVMKFFDAVETLFNRGDGTFRRGASYAVAGGQGPAVGDFDLDGDPDLVAASLAAPDATLMANGGDGSLGPFTSLAVGHATQQVAAADLDGRGGLDLVFTDNDPDLDAVTVFLNDATALRVGIDVQPWDPRNRIDPGSTRLVAVAVLGSSGFDALQCDLTSIRLDPGNARARNYRVYDVNRDGFPDLLTYFRSREIPIGCGESDVVLSGMTSQGVEFYGSDRVMNIRCR